MYHQFFCNLSFVFEYVIFCPTKFKDWNAETIPCFSWIYKQPDERSRHGGFVQQQLLTSRDECEWEGHVAPLIDRCSLIGKGVGFFTAFFRDSERKPAVSSVLGTACTCCKLHLGSRNRVRERMKKSQREREREDRWRWRDRGAAFHNNKHRVKRFHNHYLVVREMLTFLNKQSEPQLFDRSLQFWMLFHWNTYLHRCRDTEKLYCIFLLDVIY